MLYFVQLCAFPPWYKRKILRWLRSTYFLTVPYWKSQHYANRDLRVYAEPLHGTIFHFRTKEGLECDAVIYLRDGRYGLVEIKLGGDKLIEAGAKNLKIIASKLDTQKMKEPSFLMVLAGVAPYAYRRQDGVYVVPIGTLRDWYLHFAEFLQSSLVGIQKSSKKTHHCLEECRGLEISLWKLPHIVQTDKSF